jgi:hypothetical protein
MNVNLELPKLFTAEELDKIPPAIDDYKPLFGPKEPQTKMVRIENAKSILKNSKK